MINLKVRIKNKTFWLTFVPTLFLLLKQCLVMCGIDYDFTELQTNLLNVISALFAVLAVLGVVVDPTTKGINDSARAMEYKEPKE